MQYKVKAEQHKISLAISYTVINSEKNNKKTLKNILENSQ